MGVGEENEIAIVVRRKRLRRGPRKQVGEAQGTDVAGGSKYRPGRDVAASRAKAGIEQCLVGRTARFEHRGARGWGWE